MAPQQLLDNLNSRDVSLRDDAERRLRALSPDDLMRFAQLELAQFQRWAWRAWAKVLVSSLLGLMLIAVALGWLSGLDKGPNHNNMLLGPLSIYVLISLFYYFWVQQRPYSRHAVVNVIKELNDVRFVSILLTMQQDLTRNIERGTVRDALTRLLPQLRLGEADHLTSEQRNVLLSLLRHPLEHVELTVTILKSLQQIGDITFCGCVGDLARIRTKYSLATVPPRVTIRDANIRSLIVKQAAQECLPFLEQRRQEAKQAQTLLRASAAVTSPGVLLRPAAPGGEQVEAEQLLRSDPDN